MYDPFKTRIPEATGPATDILPVLPADETDLPQVAAALYIETGGPLSIVTASNEIRTIIVGDLSVLPVRARRVRATGTTATGIHALFIA